MSVVGISTKGNPEQQEEERLIMDNAHPIVAVTGDAGTGKTFIAIATALQLLRDKKYGTIYYARNPVQFGEAIGFTPGTEEDKLQGYLYPLIDNADNIARIGKVMTKDEILNKIDAIPVYTLRGRTIDNAIVIVDECQNFNTTELKTIMTRIGKYSKLILLGSMNQIDARKQDKNLCDFQKVIERLTAEDGLEEFAHIRLIQSMRAPWCVHIDELLSEVK